MQWSKLLEYYKFIIYYTLEKKNGKANTISRKKNYIKTREIFNPKIRKINNNRLLLPNQYKLGLIIYIKKDN